ncbi:MAG: TSUP family transporter [Treponema sp.]|nr:TSUP family transporter [Treponema sp.]
MELTLNAFLIVCPLVFLAGFIDSIAGGGGLISLPAYLMAGLPPQTALGTNKLSSVFGASIASFRYYKNKFVDIFICLPSIAAALAGSAIGSSFALLVNEKIIRWVLLVIIPVTAVYLFLKKDSDKNPQPLSRVKTIILSAVISFFIGGYDGFSGPGTGTFLILLYNGIAKIDLRIASGNAKLINFSSNLSALTLFLLNGRVLIPLGICAALFNMLGAYIGSGLVIHKGSKIVRVTILVVLALIFIKLVWDTFI